MRSWCLAVALCVLGVSAQAEALGLAWDPSPSEGVIAYRVYVNGALVGETTGLEWAGLSVSAGSTVVFGVTAVVSDGGESDPTTLQYTAPLPTPVEACGLDGYGNGVDEDQDGLIDEGCQVRPSTDTTKPTVMIAAVLRNGSSHNYTVNLTASDGSGIRDLALFVNGVRQFTCGYSPCAGTVALKRKGQYDFLGVANDVYGNQGTSSVWTVVR